MHGNKLNKIVKKKLNFPFVSDGDVGGAYAENLDQNWGMDVRGNIVPSMEVSPGPLRSCLEGKSIWPKNKCATVCPKQMEEIRKR